MGPTTRAVGGAALLALVAGALFFQDLGRYPLLDPDEARHAEVAREMAAGHGLRRLFLPTLDLEPYREKPAGYVGSTVSACVLLLLAARSRQARWPLIALAGWCMLVTLLYVRDAFTLAFVSACALALGLLARFGASWLRRGVLVFLAAFSCCYALYDIRDDLLHLTSWSSGTDADALARATFIPAIVWGVAWGALSIGLLLLTLRRILRLGTPYATLHANPDAPSRDELAR